MNFVVIYLHRGSPEHGWGEIEPRHPHVFADRSTWTAAMRWLLTSRSAKVLAPFGYRGSLRLSLLAAVRLRPRVHVVTRSDSNTSSLATERWLVRQVRRLVLKAAFPRRTRVWTVGRENQAFWNEYVGRRNATMIPYSTPKLPDSLGEPADVRPPSDPERMKILYVGRLTAVKNLADLVSAFRQLDRPLWSLTLVGDGPLRAELEQAAADDPRITFTGSVEYEKLDQHYRASDVLVLPSTYEPWGLVVNEALAFGLRVVVSDRVGSRELLGEGHAVVPHGDVAALVRALDDSANHVDRVVVPPFDASAAMAAELRELVGR